MKKSLSYLLLIFTLLFTAVFSVNAIEINVENNNASFSGVYSKLEDAKKAVNDFENYVKENKGVVVSTKTDKIVNEINTVIANGLIESDSLEDLDASATTLKGYYNDISTDDVRYEVVLGDIKTIENETVDYEYESGKVGEYNNYAAAYVVSRMVEAYNNRDDYEYRTRIERERRVINTIVANINGSFNNSTARGLYLFGYTLAGFDLSNVNVYESIVTDVENETREFASFDERDQYISELENDGYRVSHDLNSIHFNEVEEGRIDIDEDFDSIADLNDYIRNIDQNYNHKDVNITDNSYDEVTDEVKTEDGFETEDDAHAFIDGFKNDYRVFNEKVTSYDDTTEETTDIVKYYTSESDANSALSNMDSITSSSIRRLSLNEIDMADVISKGDTGLDSSNRAFNYFSADLTTRVYVGNRTENAAVTINSVTINGRPYRLLNTQDIANNSKVVVTGTVNYCNRGGLFGTLCIPTIANFTSEGILNRNNNASITQNLFFQYSISSVIVNNNGSVVVNDNLADIYRLDATKTTQVTKTLYKAEANIYGVRRINSFNINGYASNIVRYPVYVVDITKEKDRTLYNAEGIATLDIYRDFYVVYYNAVRTIRGIELSYEQPYSIVEITKDITYKASGTAKLNVMKEEKAPNTGIDSNNKNNYLYLILAIIPLGYVVKKLED